MDGYVARKGNRWYAVIYHGLDPVTGREQRTWHAAGTDRDAAERLARKLAKEAVGREDGNRSLTFGAYLTRRWLPAKKIQLAPTTFHGYERIVHLHVLPSLGAINIRRLTPDHLESLYTSKLSPADGSRPLSRKTVLEIHGVIRGALSDALLRGIVNRNVASIAARPTIRNVPPVEPRAWDETQLRAFLQAAAGHRLYAAFRLSAATGMRRSEVLGLKWTDVDWTTSTISVDRGLVVVGYEREVTRCKTASSRRQIELDPTTLAMLATWRDWQQSCAVCPTDAGPEWLFPADDGGATHPHAFSQAFDRIVRRAGLPPTRLHDLRHTHASLLIKHGVPLKVVSERLGHAKASFTMDTYQHVMPGMQADAARTYERIVTTHTASTARPASTGSCQVSVPG
ncbi:MAG: site-specific integrase [Microthrixaceae bacterium]|nr:site-specific integrase [Microthrixaceae bacterium]